MLKVKHETFLKFILFFNLFFPTFNSILDRTGATGVIIINFIMLIFLLLSIIYIYKRNYFFVDRWILYFMSITLIYLVNIIITSLLNTKLITSDVFELFRPIFYFSSFLFAYLLVKLQLIKAESIIRLFAIFITLTAVFSLVNILFFDVFGRDVMGLYAKDTLLPGRRFTGTFQNPYDFAFIGTLPLAYFLIQFITKGGGKYLLVIGILFITILFGQSKSGAATFLAVTGLILLLLPLYVNKHKSIGNLKFFLRLSLIPMLFISFVSVIVLLYSDQFVYLINGLSRLSGGGDHSTQIRLMQGELALQMLNDNWINLIFGFGSYKSYNLMFESLYSLYIFRYGLISLLLLFSWILLPIILLVAHKKMDVQSTYKLVLLCAFIAVIPSGIGNNVIDQSRIPFIFFSLIGVTCALCYKK